jgi:hypothetical protein
MPNHRKFSGTHTFVTSNMKLQVLPVEQQLLDQLYLEQLQHLEYTQLVIYLLECSSCYGDNPAFSASSSDLVL